jgi:hypothetical protein
MSALGCENIKYLCCRVLWEVMSTSKLRRKSNGTVEVGRPATEID